MSYNSYYHLLLCCALIGTIRAAANEAATETRDVKETERSLSQKNEDYIPVSRGGHYYWLVSGRRG